MTVKQMKDGTLRTLRLQGQPLDERDWKIIGNFLRVTTSLKELDLTYSHGSLEQLGEAIKQNKSLSKITLTQIVQDHNMPLVIDILKSNPGITQLNLNNCYMQGMGLGQLARFVKGHPGLTHLSLDGINFEELNPGFDRGMGLPKLATITKALKDSPNLLEFSPSTPETESVCTANKLAVETLLKNALETPELLSAKEIESIKTRLTAFVHVAETTVRKPDQIAQLLVNIEDAAAAASVAFEIPNRYADRANALPRPFHPSNTPVDFDALKGSWELAKPEPAPRLYQAVEAGQTHELLAYLKKEGMKLTADACLLKVPGKRESVIQLIARQGKLAEVMTVDNWLGDPRGLKAVAETVPAREWQRQLKDLPAERLIFQVNAASFKEAKRPKVQPAGPR
jgi:hypothetical protein